MFRRRNVVSLFKKVIGRTESVKLSKGLVNKLQKKLLDAETCNNFRSKVNLASDVGVKTAKKRGDDPEPVALLILKSLRDRFNSVIYAFKHQARTSVPNRLNCGGANKVLQNIKNELEKEIKQRIKTGQVFNIKNLMSIMSQKVGEPIRVFPKVGEPIRSLKSDVEVGKKLIKMTY